MITAFVAVLAVALFAVVGLAVDSGRAISAQRILADEAGQAARAAAGRLSVNSLRNGQVTIEDASAIDAAKQYMSLCGHPATAWVDDDTVTVRVVEVVPTTILGIVRINTITVSATASASDLSGVAGQG